MIKYSKKIPIEIKYTLFLFIITRIVLTIIGGISRLVLSEKYQIENLSKNLFLSSWGTSDSGWYLDVANHGYINSIIGESNLGFFPFYPGLIRIIGFLVKDYYISGLIVSNIFLIIAAVYLYKIIRLENNEETSLRGIKYLFLFPVAFILSGVFSESIFLALLLICFYYAKKPNWLVVGISGFFLSLTRPFGILMFIPLMYMYLKSRNFKFKNIQLNILYLFLIFLGAILFMTYTYYLTGDFNAYVHSKEIGWHQKLTDPFTVFFYGFSSNDYGISLLFNTIFILTMIILLCIFYKKIGFSYWMLGILLLLAPVMSGTAGIVAFARYTLVVFPLFIIFSKLGKNKFIDEAMMIIFILLQGFLMVFWNSAFNIII